MKSLPQFLLAALVSGLPLATLKAAQPYAVVDTGQMKCYDNRGETAPPKPGQPFSGQDAQQTSAGNQERPQ